MTEQEAQILLNETIQKLSTLGFGVVADGTVHGNGIWLNSLRVIPSKPSSGEARPINP